MKIFNLLLVALAPIALARAPLTVQDGADGIADNYIVVMKVADKKTLEAHYKQMNTTAQQSKDKKGVRRTYEISNFNGYHIECDNSTLDTIRKDPNVRAKPTYYSVVTMQTPISYDVPRSDAVANKWGLGRISHRESGHQSYLKEAAAESAMQTYAYIVDSGIHVTHQEFGGRATFGQNFVEGSPDTDETGHGTHVAGTVGGNTVGVDNTTQLIAVKIFDKNGIASGSGVIAGMDWAAKDAQARDGISRSVINLSVGSGKSQAQNDAVANVVRFGMTVVVAAGNSGVDACTVGLGSTPEAITVAAIDECDKRADFSDWGSCVDIFAPGVNIYSASYDSDSGYATHGGTSMACPYVSGLVTYLMSRELISGPAAIASRLTELATQEKVKDPKGSPNMIAFNGNKAELFYDSNSGPDECPSSEGN
ncbi:subtilisin-like protein [Hypoxylon cercidicola]|nr:subtilisin-like protein [Hypoxylon cercidicola]